MNAEPSLRRLGRQVGVACGGIDYVWENSGMGTFSREQSRPSSSAL